MPIFTARCTWPDQFDALRFSPVLVLELVWMVRRGNVLETKVARFTDSHADAHPNSEDHNLHRTRRKPLDPFFSRKAVQSYEGMILEELSLLEDRLLGLKGTAKVINMEHVYAAVVGDLIGRVSVIDPPSFISDTEISSDWYTWTPSLRLLIIESF